MPLQIVASLIPTVRELRLKLVAVNRSDTYEQFRQLGCSWEDVWRCDGPKIDIAPHPCTWNPERMIVLPPGQAFTEEVRPLLVFGQPGRRTFRFGLIRNKSLISSDELERRYRASQSKPYIEGAYAGFSTARETFWSPPVTVDIRREWLVH